LKKEAHFFENRSTVARMRVPKMVKNGFNSVPSARVMSRGLDTEWKSGTGTKAKGGIKTILGQFRNSHARYP
jgi:hypothetical protein